MNYIKIIYILLLSGFLFSSCKDDNVPALEKQPVSKDQLLGGWSVQSTYPYINVNPSVKPLLSGLNLDKKLEEKLASEAKGISFYFMEDSICFYRDEVLIEKSRYTIKDYIIELENPYLIGFFAPYYYVKMENGLLIMYLRKEETLNLLEKDGSISLVEMNMIRQVVDDAQCELRFRRNDLPI
jgi:hypothetical protein